MSKRPSVRPRGADTHGLVGLYLHTIQDGRIHNQGLVRSVDDGLALVQLFSFMDGRPTNVVPMALADVYACKLYHSRMEWIRAHLVEMDNEGRLHLGTVDEVLDMHAEGGFFSKLL